jgi:hypothetical protein
MPEKRREIKSILCLVGDVTGGNKRALMVWPLHHYVSTVSLHIDEFIHPKLVIEYTQLCQGGPLEKLSQFCMQSFWVMSSLKVRPLKIRENAKASN